MKKTLLYAILLLAVVTTGCKKDDNPSDEKTKTPVSFVIEEEVTRTVTNGNTTTFTAGDQIGISASGLATEMNNSIFTVGSNGALTGDSFYYDGMNPATFYAHYPVAAEYGNGNVKMTVSSDQSNAEKFNANDFMTATAVGDPATGGTVVLKFHHRLTLVKVIWGGSLTASAANLENVLPEVTWAQTANTLTTGGNATSINMWKTSADAQEYWAVIPAQTVEEGTDLVTITDGGKVFKYITGADINFRANTIKKISLTVKPDGSVEAAISEIDIENWDNDVVDGGGMVEEVVTPPVEIISAEAGKNITLTPNSKNNAAEGAWNVAVEKGSSIYVTSDEEIFMNIGTDAKWWNNAVYYRPDAATAAKIRPTIYKLTFEAKASVAEKGFMIQVMKGDESGNMYFGIINSDPAGKDDVTYNRMYYPSFKTAQVETGFVKMTYWVNFAQKIDAAGTTVTEASVGDYEKVLLTLSVNTGSSAANAYGVDFHFRNFEFIEVK